MDIYLDKENMVMFLSVNGQIKNKEAIDKIRDGFAENFPYQVVIIEDIKNIKYI